MKVRAVTDETRWSGDVVGRLGALDAVFVDAEDESRNTSMAIASIAVFEGPVPTHEEVLAGVAERLALLPRYRQKLRPVPFRLGRPVWVDDPDFDLSYHIRRIILPEPGRDEQLAELMGRVMSERLDRDHPLWEYWVIEGLARDRWALISKVHHCMVDGVSGADLYRVLMEPSPELPQPAAGTQRDERPSAVSLIAAAAADMMMLPVRDVRALSGAVTNPGQAIRQAAGVARAAIRFSPSLWPAVGSSLSGNIGQQRRYTWTRASLQDVKTIKNVLGGTVNDAVLAAISSGFRALLLDRGERPEPHEVPSLVPVSLRAPGVGDGGGSSRPHRGPGGTACRRPVGTGFPEGEPRGDDRPGARRPWPLQRVPAGVLRSQAGALAAPARDRHGHHECAGSAG